MSNPHRNRRGQKIDTLCFTRDGKQCELSDLTGSKSNLLPLVGLKPFCPANDLNSLPAKLKKVKEQEGDDIYLLTVVENLVVQQRNKVDTTQRHAFLPSETGKKGEDSTTTGIRGLEEEIGVELKPNNALTQVSQGQWRICNKKKITSLWIGAKQLEPIAKKRNIGKKADNTEVDDRNRKTIIYIWGTKEQFKIMFANGVVPIDQNGENITGFMCVPATNMIEVMKNIRDHMQNEFLPLREAYNEWKSHKGNQSLSYTPMTKKDLKTQLIRYFQSIRIGNQTITIDKIINNEFQPPRMPTVCSWNFPISNPNKKENTGASRSDVCMDWRRHDK